MLLRLKVLFPPPISSSSTTPVIVNSPFPFTTGAAVASISSKVPILGPYTARPFTTPTSDCSAILRSGLGVN
ncbi:hypothetical protein D3C77_602960 [compost metagenome]